MNIKFISTLYPIFTLKIIKILIKIKINEAIACTRKYLIEDSVELELNCLIIRGIIIIKFSSSPIHLINQEEAVIAIKVPEIRREVNDT